MSAAELASLGLGLLRMSTTTHSLPPRQHEPQLLTILIGRADEDSETGGTTSPSTTCAFAAQQSMMQSLRETPC